MQLTQMEKNIKEKLIKLLTQKNAVRATIAGLGSITLLARAIIETHQENFEHFNLIWPHETIKLPAIPFAICVVVTNIIVLLKNNNVDKRIEKLKDQIKQ